MKVAFFHDTKLIEGNNQKVYSTGFGYEIWERYLKVFDSVVVCTRKNDESIENINRYKLSSGSNVEFKLNTFYKTPIQFFTSYKQISMPIKQIVEDVDACIVRLPSIIGILAVQECLKQNKPWMIEVVGCGFDSFWNYGNIKGKLLAPIMFAINRYYINKSKYVTYVSNEFLQKKYPCKGTKSSISDVNIKQEDEFLISKRLDRIDNIKKCQPIILGLIGSLDVEYKGHRIAIKTIKELKKSGYNVHLKCLGGGNSNRWKQLCKDLEIEDRVEFCGTLPSGEPVLEWLDNIDIFVMPSFTEGFPRSLVEAMSRGCNVTGSNVGGIPELIQSVFLFKCGDYKKMSEIVIKFISNKDLMKVQSKMNIIEANKYTQEKIDKKRTSFLMDFKNSIK